MLVPGNFFGFIHSYITSKYNLLFSINVTIKVNFRHIVRLFTTIIILIITTEFILIFTVIAQHRILDIGTNGITATLRWEAHFTKHTGMLVLFADNEAHLSVF